MVTSFDGQLLKKFKECAPDAAVGILTVPDLSFLSMFNLSQYLPADKALADYELEDVKEVPGMISMILKSFGAKGRTPAETILEVVAGIAAVTPPGTTWKDLKAVIA